MSEPIIQTRGLTKEYVRDEFHVFALRDANIDIHEGETINKKALKALIRAAVALNASAAAKRRKTKA